MFLFICVLSLLLNWTKVFFVSNTIWIWQSVWRLHLPVCQQSVCEPGVEVWRHGRLRGLLRWSQLWWGGRYSDLICVGRQHGLINISDGSFFLQSEEASGSDVSFCSVLQPLPLTFPAARSISASSVKTDAAFPRGGSVMEKTTAETGLMRPSVQVQSPVQDLVLLDGFQVGLYGPTQHVSSDISCSSGQLV